MSRSATTVRKFTEDQSDQFKISTLLNSAEALYEKSLNPRLKNEQCAACRKEAKDIADILANIKETRPLALNLLARIAIDEGFYDQANSHLVYALKEAPEDPSLLYSQGHVFLARQEYEEAEKLFARAFRINPSLTRAASSLAYTKTRQGKFVEAFQDYRELIKSHPDDPHIRTKLFECTAKITANHYDEELADDILSLYLLEGIDYTALGNITASLLIHKYDIPSLLQHGLPLGIVDTVCQDKLLCEALSKIIFCQPDLEKFITQIRKQLLLESLVQSDLKQLHVNLAVALSLYASNMEYSLYIDSQEYNLLSALEDLINAVISATGWKPSDLAGATLLYGMYLPMDELSCATELAKFSVNRWPVWARKTINHALLEIIQEKQNCDKIPSIGQISDATSQKVQAQYEQNPYPRWLHLSYNTPTNYGRAMEQEFPDFRAPSFFNTGDINVLIAGCGTGQHAIKVAKYFRNVNVTAIDLSRRSLVYASKMAEKYHVKNIEFIQADILNLDQLKQQFHIIESSGVLHHMADPMAGLAALKERLVPGGLMKLALYSRAARQIILKSRELIQKNKLTGSAQHIRLFRQAILHNNSSTAFSGMLSSSDFYNMSGCRDLVFHEHETQFDLLQIDEMLTRFNLNFIGLLVQPLQRLEFIEFIGSDQQRGTLAEWAEFEQQHPQSFGGMYQFYCQKPRQAPTV
ncbi:class I SAM-dependent methyltransferase [Gynuella sunshinyii]|nr:class I SAM-dependent methyltransferase [Gynuella sunshinyii]